MPKKIRIELTLEQVNAIVEALALVIAGDDADLDVPKEHHESALARVLGARRAQGPSS